MRKEVSYIEPVVYQILKETMEDPAGRSFVLLLFLDHRGDAFSGYYLTPYRIGKEKNWFQSVEGFAEKVSGLVEKVLEKDRHGELVECCSQWIAEDTPRLADLVIYFSISENSEWTGRFLDSRKKYDDPFRSREEMIGMIRKYQKRAEG